LNQCALTPAVCQYFFADVSPFFVMFWHDLRQEGWGAMVTMFRRGAWCLVSLSLCFI
jgi:hypothetical protein